MNKEEELKNLLKLYSKKDIWEFNQQKIKIIDEKDQQIADLKAENERLKGELREQNKLLQLAIPKFEISQVVYSIRNINTIMPLTISSYNYNEKTKRLEYWNSFDVFIGTNEDIFATKEEAETKLKGLRGDKE